MLKLITTYRFMCVVMAALFCFMALVKGAALLRALNLDITAYDLLHFHLYLEGKSDALGPGGVPWDRLQQILLASHARLYGIGRMVEVLFTLLVAVELLLLGLVGFTYRRTQQLTPAIRSMLKTTYYFAMAFVIVTGLINLVPAIKPDLFAFESIPEHRFSDIAALQLGALMGNPERALTGYTLILLFVAQIVNKGVNLIEDEESTL